MPPSELKFRRERDRCIESSRAKTEDSGAFEMGEIFNLLRAYVVLLSPIRTGNESHSEKFLRTPARAERQFRPRSMLSLVVSLVNARRPRQATRRRRLGKKSVIVCLPIHYEAEFFFRFH